MLIASSLTSLLFPPLSLLLCFVNEWYKHLRDSGSVGEDVQGAGGEGSILREGGRNVCVEPHVLILIHIEYERQAEIQLVTSELAPCYLREHMPSASSSATQTAPSLFPAK